MKYILFIIFIIVVIIIYYELNRKSYFILFPKKSCYFEKIPKIIHQTWDDYKSIPECCKDVIKKNRIINPNWEYRFYTLSDRRQIIKDNFSERVLKAYDKLSTSTLSADMFRICCLYIYGGIYMDIKSYCGDLNSLPQVNKLLYIKWPYYKSKLDHPNHAATSFLIWPAKHWILKKVLDEMIRRIFIHTNKEIKKHITFITGPNLYAQVVCKHVPSKCMYITNNYFNGLFKHDGTNGEYYKYIKLKGKHWHQQT